VKPERFICWLPPPRGGISTSSLCLCNRPLSEGGAAARRPWHRGDKSLFRGPLRRPSAPGLPGHSLRPLVATGDGMRQTRATAVNGAFAIFASIFDLVLRPSMPDDSISSPNGHVLSLGARPTLLVVPNRCAFQDLLPAP